MNLKVKRIELFVNKSILSFNLRITVIDQHGKPEQGENDRVVRDIIFEFFSEFVTFCTMRCMEAVAAIRHTKK